MRSLYKLCSLRVSVETYVAPRPRFNVSAVNASETHSATADTHPRCVACGEPHHSGECSTPRQQLKCCSCGGKHTANYRGCAKWKEAKAALANRTPNPRVPTNGAIGRSASAQATRAEPSAQQKSVDPEWSHVVRGGRVVKPTTPSQPETTLKPAVAPKQGKASASRKERKAAQPAVEAPQQAPMKNKAMTGKSFSRPQKPNPASIPPPNQSPIEEIADLLDNLPVNACVELTWRLLTAVPSLPSDAARSRAILKIVILFVAEYGSIP